jgi:DNA-binding LacI/PurR family transcriptional regulator
VSAKSRLKLNSIALMTLGHGRGWLELPVAGAVFSGIQRGASSHGLRLGIDEMPSLDRPPRILVDREVDGIIVIVSSEIPISMYPAAFALLQKYVPVVWAMNAGLAGAEVDHVAPDNIGIGQIAYNYLRKQGCKRLGFLTADPAWPMMRTRGQSFLNCALDDQFPATAYVAAAPGVEHSVVAYGREIVTAPTLPSLVTSLVQHWDRPDGLFVCNDATTGAIYPLLQAAGIQPMRDIHIISCDAEEARLSGLYPRPMSIDIGAEEIGYRSVLRLLNRIQRPAGAPIIINVAPRLAPPPAASL